MQFDFSAEALAELDELQRQTGLATRADLVRHALRFMQWGLEETEQEGNRLLIDRNGDLRELVFPFWRAKKPVDEPVAVSSNK